MWFAGGTVMHPAWAGTISVKTESVAESQPTIAAPAEEAAAVLPKVTRDQTTKEITEFFDPSGPTHDAQRECCAVSLWFASGSAECVPFCWPCRRQPR